MFVSFNLCCSAGLKALNHTSSSSTFDHPSPKPFNALLWPSLWQTRNDGQDGFLGPDSFSTREAGDRFVESVRLSAMAAPNSDGSGLHLEEVPGGQIAVASVDYGSLGFQGEVLIVVFVSIKRDNVRFS